MIYKPTGVCSSSIEVEVRNGIIDLVNFTGGCNGNLKGISCLVEGMTVDQAISKLKGLKCGYKTTSCPDQLACALEKIKSENC